jgi:hypothetical protein
VANHAYQNSDFSPYSGQQPEAISRNLQASCVLKMITGNRGELGKALLRKQNATVANFLLQVEEQAKRVIKRYESIANDIIDALGVNMSSTGFLPLNTNTQRLASCFRCAEVGSTTTWRENTNTYVPSFIIPDPLVATARMYVAPIYGDVIQTIGGVTYLLIYKTSLAAMSSQFQRLATMGIFYQPPVLKTTLTTMDDETDYIKINATSGKPDNGVYAATRFRATYADTQGTARAAEVGSTGISARLVSSSGLPGYDPSDLEDMYGLNGDTNCDNDATYVPGMVCNNATQLLMRGGDFANQDSSSDNSATVVGATVGVLVPLAIIGAVIAGVVIYRRRKAAREQPGFKRQHISEAGMATTTGRA